MATEKRATEAPSAKGKRLFELVDDFGDKYDVLAKRDYGASGIVFKAKRKSDPDSQYAVKFYVPMLNVLFSESSMASIETIDDGKTFATEQRFLRQARHPGIQEVISWGELKNPAKVLGAEAKGASSVNFLVSRWVEGDPLMEWVSHLSSLPAESNARERLLAVLVELAETLCYIHDTRKFQHGDIRSKNILIHRASQRPVLIDFGNAHFFGATEGVPDVTRIRFFAETAPQETILEVRNLLKSTGSQDVSRRALKEILFPGLDLYHFGLLLQEVTTNESARAILSRSDIDYLALVATRLTKWKLARTGTATSIREHLRRLLSGYSAFGGAASSGGRAVATPRGEIQLPRVTEDLLKTQGFRRLQLLNQLSLLYLVYPAATQTRFEHSLSVYGTSQRLLASLSNSPRFRLLFDRKGAETFLLTALLHDINHFPFLHYFQELSVEALQRVDVWNFFADGKATKDKPSVVEVLDQHGFMWSDIKNILVSDWHKLTDPMQQVTKSIIDSGLDVDKISYVRDDSTFTGVPFGVGIDERALFEAADIVQVDKTKAVYHLCFSEEALSAVESVLLARYWNFKQIYWHHTNRAVGAMILFTIHRLFVEKGLTLEEYLSETIETGETGALQFLASRYKKIYGEPSLLDGLVSRRDRIYKRLFSIKHSLGGTEASGVQDTQRILFDGLKKLSLAARQEVLGHLAVELKAFFKEELNGYDFVPGDILLDIPGRSLDEKLKEIWVCQLAADGRVHQRVQSPFLDVLEKEFGNLSRTIRFFVNPAIREKIGREQLDANRVEVEEIVKSCMEKASGEAGKIIR